MSDQSPPLNCVFANENELYASYMSFLKNGGLFIRSKPGVAPNVSIDEELDLSVTIPKDTKVYTLKVKVVWITPIGVKGNKPPGYGVMFLGEEGALLTKQIEKCIGALVSSGQPTDTI